MRLIIAKVNETLFDGEAYSLGAPGAAGDMTVLGRHEPLITTLKKGTLSVRLEAHSEPTLFPIEGGVLEIRSEGATVIL